MIGGLLQSSILCASSETVFSRKKPPQSKSVQPPRTLWLLEGEVLLRARVRPEPVTKEIGCWLISSGINLNQRSFLFFCFVGFLLF